LFFGYLANLQEELSLYPKGIQAGLKFLLEADLASLAPGRHEIDGAKIYASVAEYETETKGERRLEAHRKYADIQCVCSGAEIIGAGPLSGAGAVDEDRLQDKDVIFYKSIAQETELLLTAGMFAVLFPWDAHRPNCNPGANSSKVRKIVVKVAVDILDRA